MWYAGEGRKKIVPWGNWDMSYQIELTPEQGDNKSITWTASVGLGHGDIDEQLFLRLRELQLYEDLKQDEKYLWVWRHSESLNDNFCDELANTLKRFIEAMTPIVRELTDESGDRN